MTQAPRPRPPEPAAGRNPFRDATLVAAELPSLATARSRLPVPVLPAWPAWVEMYWRAWELVWTHLHRPRTGSRLVASYVEAETGNLPAMADAALITQYGLYGRRAFDFAASLHNFYARQHDDGFICREIDGDGGADLYLPFDPDGTGATILSWAEWRHYRISGDEGRLARVFWPLLALHRWCRANRTWPSGLYWATGLSSGMDNQNRVPGGRHHHQHWTWVDASMQAALDVSALTQMATALKEEALALALADEHQSLVRAINARLWNPERGFYQDLDPRGEFGRARSVGAYWGLVDHQLVPADRLTPFVQPLRDSGAFNTPHRVPSLSADSEGYDGATGNRWRGAVWPAMVFMVLKGLRTAGHHRLAHEIALNHLQNVCDVYRRTDTFWENYAPGAAAPGDPAQRDYVGVAGLAPIAILLEDAIGLHVDWPLRRVSWRRHLASAEPYGVRNYPLGPDGWLDIVGNGERVEVTTDVPFTLQIRDPDGQSLQAAVPVGTTTIELT